MRLRRGVSNIIVAILVLTAIALSLPTLFFYTYASKARQEMKAFSYLEIEERARYVEIDAVAVISNNVLQVIARNRGGKEVRIERVFALSTCGGKGTILKLSDSSEILPPGGFYQIVENLPNPYCPRASIGGVYITTSEPRVYSARLYNMTMISELSPVNEDLSIMAPMVHVMIPIELRDNPWELSRVLSGAGFLMAAPDKPDAPTRLVLLDIGNVLAQGMKTAAGRWVMPQPNNFTNVDVRAENIQVRNMFLGYDPRDPSKYVMLITIDGSVSLTIGGTVRAFCPSAPAARIKVYGFKNTTAQGIVRVAGDTERFGSGKWLDKPDQDVAEYTFLNKGSRGTVYFIGRADRVEVYCFEVSQSTDTSYFPYILLMNTVDRQGRAALLFTTIDAIYGFASSRNDRPGSYSLQDYSRQPITLVYKNIAIDNNNTKAVLISLNYRFHDNEGNDFSGATIDQPIVIAGLIDEEGKVVSYRSFTFRELTRYEDTYPPTAQAQSALVFIPLPSKEAVGIAKFYVFILVQDPYLFNAGNNNLDDIDITLYIESLSVLLFE